MGLKPRQRNVNYERTHRKMTAVPALLAMTLLSAGFAACGGATQRTAPASGISSSTAATTTSPEPVPTAGYLASDGDSDENQPGAGGDFDDASFFATYGREAGSADKRAITAVVKSFYAAAAADDGQKACLLLSSSVAIGLAEDKLGQAAGKTCATAVSALFKQQRGQLAAEDVGTMVVISAHVKGDLGLAVLGFKRTPRRQLIVEREGHAWRVGALFDGEVP